MNISQRLRTCAKHTGLDSVIELLQEAADEIDALQARARVQGELEPYDAGLLNDFGGGNVGWWQDYIRAELGRAYDFYQSQIAAPQPAQATQSEVTGGREAFESCALMEGSLFKRRADDPDKYWDGNVQDDWELWQARAILTLRPVQVPMTPRDLELIDGMVAVQLDHAQRCDAISNRAMAEKQKGWDMERVELLRRIRSFGITAQAKKETP